MSLIPSQITPPPLRDPAGGLAWQYWFESVYQALRRLAVNPNSSGENFASAWVTSGCWIKGTVPLLAGSGWLPAGTYQIPEADCGCHDPAFAAVVKLLKQDGTEIVTINTTAGGVSWKTGAAGFTLAAGTYIDVTLAADAAAGVAYLKGLRVHQ